MNGHFQKELTKIKKMVLSLGAMVEDRVQLVRTAIDTIDGNIAKEIIQRDMEIDEMEVDLEEECLRSLALYQPVATDLRFLVAVIKINNDLERIGDEAVNVAQRIEFLSSQKVTQFPFDYNVMVEKAQGMLQKSLDSLVNMDLDLAIQVLSLDDAVDEMKAAAYDKIKDSMRQHPDQVGNLINMLLISRHLERIADHATNIAEEVIYMIEGDIVRHTTP